MMHGKSVDLQGEMGSSVKLVEYALMCSEEVVMGEIVWERFETEVEDKKEGSEMLSKEIQPLRRKD